MVSNIACFSPGCTNAVVGQCAGYDGPCGRFYCAAHSEDGLCEQCAEKKKQAGAARENEELYQRLFDDYVQAAEQIPRLGCANYVVSLVLMTVVFLAFSSLDPTGQGMGMGIGAVLAWTGFFVYAHNVNKRKKQRLVESEETRPGFQEFYAEWLDHRNKAEFKSGVLFGLSATSTAIDTYQRARQGAALSDIHAIAEDTARIVKKLK